jgi:16S rRNA (adenine1518-N6/adenine1519-N6)-dimethyltransferase
MIAPKKSLGQNFLKNDTVVAEIVKAGNVGAGDTVLEIGPGEGVLTAALLRAGATVLAVEKDDRLIPILKEKFFNYIAQNKLILVHKDILEFDPASFELQAASYKLIANIPYYITGQILRQFLGGGRQPTMMILMLQKEVAERILGKDSRWPHSKESILSLSVKAYGRPSNIRTVAKGNFQPAPSVDSAILLIKDISKHFFKDFSENRFFETVKKGFGQKRKMLKGNLGLSAETMEQCGLPIKARAEDLNLDQWKCLIRELESQRQLKK